MIYMIVIWENKQWKILHYSHQYEDARKWYDEFKQRYPVVYLMCDAFVMKEENTKKEFLDFLDKFRKK